MCVAELVAAGVRVRCVTLMKDAVADNEKKKNNKEKKSLGLYVISNTHNPDVSSLVH